MLNHVRKLAFNVFFFFNLGMRMGREISPIFNSLSCHNPSSSGFRVSLSARVLIKKWVNIIRTLAERNPVMPSVYPIDRTVSGLLFQMHSPPGDLNYGKLLWEQNMVKKYNVQLKRFRKGWAKKISPLPQVSNTFFCLPSAWQNVFLPSQKN